MTDYVPELGQMVFGNPTGRYAMPRYAEALLLQLADEIARVFWNREQREWDRREDPRLEGMAWRPYYWGDDEAEEDKPNFVFRGVEIRWYNHPGRGMSCDRTLTPAEWADWYEAASDVLEAADRKVLGE